MQSSHSHDVGMKKRVWGLKTKRSVRNHCFFNLFCLSHSMLLSLCFSIFLYIKTSVSSYATVSFSLPFFYLSLFLVVRSLRSLGQTKHSRDVITAIQTIRGRRQQEGTWEAKRLATLKTCHFHRQTRGSAHRARGSQTRNRDWEHCCKLTPSPCKLTLNWPNCKKLWEQRRETC